MIRFARYSKTFISISSMNCNKLPKNTFCALYIMAMDREGIHCGFEKQNFVSKFWISLDMMYCYVISYPQKYVSHFKGYFA